MTSATVGLVGSTHEERVVALSDAIQRTNPQKDRVRFDALFDAYLICLAYERRKVEFIGAGLRAADRQAM